MKLTQVTLLDRMQIGRDYNPTYLAQYFDVTTAILRDELCALAQEGFVKMINKADGKIAFRRVRNEPLSNIEWVDCWVKCGRKPGEANT
jgi:hypothetical protein